MTNWREIESLRKDPEAVAALSMRLLAVHGDELNERELQFLNDLIHERCPRALQKRLSVPLTTRQIEWLVDIRDGLKICTTTHNGFSVKLLIENCWLARSDLDEYSDALKFLESVHGQSTLKTRQVGLLLHVARKLHVIENEADEAA